MKSIGTRRLLTLVVVLGAILFATPAAMAQDGTGDPYGSTTTSQPPDDRDPHCRIQVDTTVAAGATVDATLFDVLEGDEIRIFVGARLVATVTVPTSDEQAAAAPGIGAVTGLTSTAAVRFGVAAAPGDNVERFPIQFTVPADMRPGRYTVEGVASTYVLACDRHLVVQAAAAGGGNRPDRGGLAFTGADILMMVLVGLALVAVGVYLRRRFAERRAHAG